MPQKTTCCSDPLLHEGPVAAEIVSSKPQKKSCPFSLLQARTPASLLPVRAPVGRIGVVCLMLSATHIVPSPWQKSGKLSWSEDPPQKKPSPGGSPIAKGWQIQLAPRCSPEALFSTACAGHRMSRPQQQELCSRCLTTSPLQVLCRMDGPRTAATETV